MSKLTINTNLASMIVQNNLQLSTLSLNKAVEQMTTGYKINHAKDNAAGYSITTYLTSKLNAYMVAQENTAMGLDMVTTASDTLDLMSNYMTQLRALATQAQNGTYGKQSLNAINSQARAIINELFRLQSNTEYNGIDLFGTNNTAGADMSLMSTIKDTGFIDDIVYVDESTLTKLSNVSETTTISSGNYGISTADDLAKLARMTNNGKITGGNFYLTDDIDLSSYSDGEGWTPIGTSSKNFKGNFDGQGHVVKNLYINRPSSDSQGLFGYVAIGKTLKNVAVVDCNVKSLRKNPMIKCKKFSPCTKDL